VDAFAVIDANNILLSFNLPIPPGLLPGIPSSFGTIDSSDIVQFTGTLGPSTSGTFSVFFDGSDVGLSGGIGGSENVDAFEILPDGSLVVSTVGTASVTGVSPNPVSQDLIRCAGTFGTTTSCTWSVYFDGSDVGLTSGNENIDGVARAAAGDIYLSTTGNFSVPGRSGANEDVFVCQSPTTGPSTTCTYSSTLYFDGSVFGLGANDLDAIDLP